MIIKHNILEVVTSGIMLYNVRIGHNILEVVLYGNVHIIQESCAIFYKDLNNHVEFPTILLRIIPNMAENHTDYDK